MPHRGTYRTSPDKWFAPEAVKPPAGSSKAGSTGGVVSKLTKTAGGAQEVTIEVPSQLAPLSLAFLLQAGAPGQPQAEELNTGGHKFAVPVGMSAGRVAPMGELAILQVLLHEQQAPAAELQFDTRED